METNFQKRSPINSLRQENMKNQLYLDQGNIPCIKKALKRGLMRYASDAKKIGGMTTLWLWLTNESVLRIRCEMHGLNKWNEIGTLIFYLLTSKEEAPTMTPLDEKWRDITEVEKLVYDAADFSAESGIVVRNSAGDALLVVTGANVYTLEIKAPFFSRDFNPKNDIDKYKHVPL